jgi:hypothetical protein
MLERRDLVPKNNIGMRIFHFFMLKRSFAAFTKIRSTAHFLYGIPRNSYKCLRRIF